MRTLVKFGSFPRLRAEKKISSTLRAAVIASAVGAVSLAGGRVASAQTIVFDSLTNATNLTYYTSTPHTAFGQVYTLGNVAAASSPITITGSDTAYVSTVAATYNYVRITQYFWATPSYAGSGTTAAYSNLLGARTYTLTNQTFTGVGYRSVNGGASSFGASSITLSGLSTANTIGFSQVITTSTDGTNYSLNENLTPLFAVGTPAVGSSAFSSSSTQTNFYENFNSESNGNFVGSDARNTGALSFMAVRLYATAAAAPEPGSLPLLGMGLVSGAGTLGITARRRRKATDQA